MGGGGFGSGEKKSGPTEVPVGYGFSGEAWVVRGGARIPLTAPKEDKLKFRDGDTIATGNGCIWGVEDDCKPEGKGRESARLELFPQSEARLSILDFEKKESGGKVLGQLITGIEPIRGLFWVQMTSADAPEKKLRLPSGCPQVQFKPDAGEWGRTKDFSMFIGIDNGVLTVFGTHCRLVHRGLGMEARPYSVSKGKVTATTSALYLTDMGEKKDLRASLAMKLHKYMISGSLKSGRDEGGESMYSLPPFAAPAAEDKVVKRAATRSAKGMDELRDDYWTRLRRAEDEMVEKRLAREKAFNEEYEGAPESVKEKAHKAIEKQNSEDYRKYSQLEKQLGEEHLAKEKELIEAGKRGLTATTKKSGISGKVAYHETEFEFYSCERGIEMGMRKAKPGMEYLVLKLRYANKSKKQVFLSPPEEFGLLCNGERVALDNYKLETNMDAGYSGEGELLFIVPESSGSFVLQVGKKLENKQEFSFSA